MNEWYENLSSGWPLLSSSSSPLLLSSGRASSSSIRSAQLNPVQSSLALQLCSVGVGISIREGPFSTFYSWVLFTSCQRWSVDGK